MLEARTQIAELKKYCLDYHNLLLLFSSSIIKESLASSEIEDVHTTLINVFQNSLLPETERRSADKEVLRYREALMYSFKELQTRDVITASLTIGIQNTLLQVQGSGFRSDQNAIVNPKTGDIIFVPPSANEIADLMRNVEEYINTPSINIQDDVLIKCAIAHY